jgi:hypothetical protein
MCVIQVIICRFTIPAILTHLDVSIQLFDVFGRQWMQTSAYKSENTLEETLNISNLPKGVYFVRIIEKGLTQTEKIYL